MWGGHSCPPPLTWSLHEQDSGPCRTPRPKTNINFKGVGQECPTHTWASSNPANWQTGKFIQKSEVNGHALSSEILAVAIVLLCGLAACTPNQNPQELKEKTARATAELKVDAKAVAAGVREGWSRDKPLDVNTATREQLVTLPGVTAAEADRDHRGASLR